MSGDLSFLMSFPPAPGSSRISLLTAVHQVVPLDEFHLAVEFTQKSLDRFLPVGLLEFQFLRQGHLVLQVQLIALAPGEMVETTPYFPDK